MNTRLSVYDFDGTLFDTPLPDKGKEIWKNKTGNDYPHIGWWGQADSLNLDVFDIKPFPNVLNQLNDDMTRSDTYTVILTSRIERLRPAIQKLLDKNNIKVNELILKAGDLEKDGRLEQLLHKFPSFKEIDLYDDREKEFKVFTKFKLAHPELDVNIYKADQGRITLLESKIVTIINDEIKKII